MSRRAAFIGLFCSMFAICPAATLHAKQCSRLITAEMRANALANISRYQWAKEEQEKAVARAQYWVDRSDEELWGLVPGQELPRGIHTNKEVGCPNCGDAIVKYGNYPWEYDINRPWRVKCPNCREMYPKNDFLAFYNSALDGHGIFRRSRGDRSLLFNAEHPDPADPLHNIFVDDGYGMVDEEGATHLVIGYCGWRHWVAIYVVVEALASAYTLTSEPIYAHKAAVLLDRIADVYPEMDFEPLAALGFEHSHGGTKRGRIEGCNWEALSARRLAAAYDHIYDGIQNDTDLVAFCSQRAAQYQLGDKGSTEELCRHIEDHLLVEILKSVTDGRVSGSVGKPHCCLVTAAVALDRAGDTERWLNWLFDPRFPGDYTNRKSSLPWWFTEGIDRDGMGGECGLYGLLWTRGAREVVGMLAACREYTERDLIAEYPKLKQCYLSEARMQALDATYLAVGCTGTTGGFNKAGSVEGFLTGYRLYRDPRLAILAWRYSGEQVDGLRGSLFEKEPMELAEEVAQIGRANSFRLQSEHLGRYGQAILQTEKPENGRALWMTYSYGMGMAQRDCLAIGLYAKNIDMLPDLGYPEYTGSWPKRWAWTDHTVSHNTLLISDKPSTTSPGGQISLFSIQPPVRVVDVSAPGAYPGVRTYRRTAAMVDVSDNDSYVLDIFRARGGSNHTLSYHGPGIAVETVGLQLVKQETGTFAGEDIAFGEFYDGEEGALYDGTGFMYLHEVEYAPEAVGNPFTVDWTAEDLRGRIEPGAEPHLRLHSLSASDEVALASGDPPRNKPGNPQHLRYLLQRRLGDNVESQFVTVLEPYATTPFIRQVRTLNVEHDADANSVAAVEVEFMDGTMDILISCEERTHVEVEGGVEFDGQFGMLRLVDGQLKLMRMSNATLLSHGDTRLVSEHAAYEGKVVGIDASDAASSLVRLDPPLPQDVGLEGRTIHFKNEVPIDTTYDIRAVTRDGVSTGDITIIWGLKDPADLAAGYKYLVNVGV